MSPELNERVAALEPQVTRVVKDVDDLHGFKEAMIKEIAELNLNIKTLSWKVSLITGAAIVFGNQLLQFGIDALKTLLP